MYLDIFDGRAGGKFEWIILSLSGRAAERKHSHHSRHHLRKREGEGEGKRGERGIVAQSKDLMTMYGQIYS